MFAFISKNWRGEPLTDYQVIVNLIANTHTEQGLAIQAALDEDLYETGKKITDAEMATLQIIHHDYHGEWNYTINKR